MGLEERFACPHQRSQIFPAGYCSKALFPYHFCCVFQPAFAGKNRKTRKKSAKITQKNMHKIYFMTEKDGKTCFSTKKMISTSKQHAELKGNFR